MATQNGTAVNFSFTGTNGITITGLNGILQSVDYEDGADKEEVRGAGGDIVSRNWYDSHTKATLRWVITGATNSIAAAITATTVGTKKAGSFVAITACASHPDLVASTWEVQSGAKIAGDVTKSAEFTIPLEKRAGITAAQPA